MKEWLRDKKQVGKDEATVEIMRVSMMSSVTAERYIRELIQLGIARNNGNHLVYVFNEEQL